MVLTDSLKQTGTVSTKWDWLMFIVNFESLEKFFVTSKPATKDLQHSTQIIMDPR
jgi:hypothetical protein